MFKRVNQPGLISIFDADQEQPLKYWSKKVRGGQIKRGISDEVKGLFLELKSKLPLNNFIVCPVNPKENLGIHYPYFFMIVKLPVATFFAFDLQVLDDKSVRRRFRVSTMQTFPDVQPFMCKLPLSTESGWNRISFPVRDYVKDIFGTEYVKSLRVAVYSNCLLKKIYFADRDYPEEVIPPEFGIEDSDPTETYRLKYVSLISQKRKNSLSHYPDLLQTTNKSKSGK